MRMLLNGCQLASQQWSECSSLPNNACECERCVQTKMRAINDIDVQHSPATQYTFSSSLKAECQKKTRF
jgi:hypothetical protein